MNHILASLSIVPARPEAAQLGADQGLPAADLSPSEERRDELSEEVEGLHHGSFSPDQQDLISYFSEIEISYQVPPAFSLRSKTDILSK